MKKVGIVKVGKITQITLSKKSHPGDGTNNCGVRGMQKI